MNRIFFKVKVCGEAAHRDSFLDGHLYMNTLGYFKRYEEGEAANIADRHEATVMLLQPGKFTMTISGEGIEDITMAVSRNKCNT
jgi:hypothetical protein